MVSITEAKEHSSLSYKQIANLARKGQIRARKTGNIWLIDLDSLKEHELEMARLGSKKHSPHGTKD